MPTVLDQNPTKFMVPIDRIYVDHDFNCREQITAIDVQDLVESILEYGLLQPISVCKYAHKDYDYKVIMGFRRYTAIKYIRDSANHELGSDRKITDEEKQEFENRVNKYSFIECNVREDELSDVDARIINLSENLQRKNLNILEEARAIKPLWSKGLGRDEIAKKLKMSPGWVQVRTMLLHLNPEIQKQAALNIFNTKDIRDLYAHKNKYGDQSTLKAAKELKEKKQRGQENVKVKEPKEEKRLRTRLEIFNMQEHIRSCIGNGLTTRAMAWTTGEISSNDLLDTIEEQVKKEGRGYTRPDWLD